jgi:hypothetical protein
LSPNAGGGGVAGSQPMSTAVHRTVTGAQINFGDLTPYLTYDPYAKKYVEVYTNYHIRPKYLSAM